MVVAPVLAATVAPRQGRSQRVNYAAVANGGGANGGALPPPVVAAAAVAASTLHASAKAAVSAAKAALSTASASVVAAEKAKADWKAEVVCLTKDEFLAMGNAGLKAGYDYYNDKYNTPGGELYSLKRAYQGATVFNPLKLMVLDPAAASLLIGLLGEFQFPEFTPPFLEGMRKELPEVIRQAKEPFDWASVRGAADYDKALAAKQARAAAAAPSSAAAGMGRAGLVAATVKDWKNDKIETARRIWEWWRVRVRGVYLLKYWPVALRLVALVQPSSAKMERIFSQLKLTLDSLGVSCLEKTVEARLFVRENAALWQQMGL